MAGKDRYTTVAIVLHWLIAISILWMVWIGLWMTSAVRSQDPAEVAAAYQGYQFHKSLGITILALSVARLIWRLTHRTPPLPAHMPGWEKFAARATHVLFYVLIIALPFSGWLYVSSGWSVHDNAPFSIPTVWFGQFTVPHLPFFEGAPPETRKAAAGASLNVHEKLAWFTLALAALHIAAALKHHLLDRDDTLVHMLPFLRRKAAVTPAATEPS